MKRILLVVLLLSVGLGVFADTAAEEPVPYSPEEFPPWLHDLRRAEIIFIGSIPVSLILSGLIYPYYRWAAKDFQSAYAPELFGGASRELDAGERENVLIFTVSLSGIITLADFIIGKVVQKKNDHPHL